MERAGHGWGYDFEVFDLIQTLSDVNQVFFSCHPVLRVKLSEAKREGISPRGFSPRVL